MSSNNNTNKWNTNNTNVNRNNIVKKQQKSNKQEQKLKYIENQQRRKQLVIQNAKRRKQKQRRLKQEEDRKRKAEENQIIKMKKQKEQAYLKYLRNNTNRISYQPRKTTGTNIVSLYDKYQAKKRQQQQAKQIKPVGKWKTSQKKSSQDTKNLQGLDLDIQTTKDLQKIKKFYQEQKEQLKLIQDFQQQWQQQQMIKSSLLDSLDLDNGAIRNSRLMSKNQQPLFQKDYSNMRQSNFFKKQKENNQELCPKIEQKIEKTQQQTLKSMIGYESINQQSNFWNIDAKKKTAQQKNLPKEDMFKKKKIDNSKNKSGEQLTKELLVKHKKQTELMGWVQNIDEAQQLFSNCSSNSKKSIPKSQLLKELNQKLRKQKLLQKEMKQKQQNDRINKQKQEAKQRAIKQANQRQIKQKEAIQKNKKDKFVLQVIPQIIQSNPKSEQSQQIPSKYQRKAIVRKTPEKIIIDKVKSPYKDDKKNQKTTNEVIKDQKPIKKDLKSMNNIKSSKPSVPIPQKPESKTVQKFRSKLSQHVIKDKSQYPITTITQEDLLNIDQYIKDDLNEINTKQMNLQQEIKQLHLENKQKIKEIQKKHEIKTHYQTTNQLINMEQNIENQFKKQFTQDQLQLSILRLDQLLIRKQNNVKKIQSEMREENNVKRIHSEIKEDQKYNTKQSSTPQFPTKQLKDSIINPLSQSNDLLLQIIKLATNYSNNKQIDLIKLKEQLIHAKNPSVNTDNKQEIKSSMKKKQSPIVIEENIKQNIKQNSNINKVTYAQLRNKTKVNSVTSLKQNDMIKKNSTQAPTQILNPPPVINKWKKADRNKKYEEIEQPNQQIKEEKQQKIQINEKLKNLLFD